MKFSERLNAYIEELSCSSKDICSLSGISAASFSRYKNGERVPEIGAKPFEELCRTIAEIAAEKDIQNITAASVREAFIACEDFVSTDREVLRQNFNTLITAFNINLTRLSQRTNYDASSIFRIRSGSRKPEDPEQFASAVATFAAMEMQTPPEIAAVAELVGCDVDKIHNFSERYSKIKNWLLSQTVSQSGNNRVSDFL